MAPAPHPTRPQRGWASMGQVVRVCGPQGSPWAPPTPLCTPILWPSCPELCCSPPVLDCPIPPCPGAPSAFATSPHPISHALGSHLAWHPRLGRGSVGWTCPGTSWQVGSCLEGPGACGAMPGRLPRLQLVGHTCHRPWVVEMSWWQRWFEVWRQCHGAGLLQAPFCPPCLIWPHGSFATGVARISTLSPVGIWAWGRQIRTWHGRFGGGHPHQAPPTH